MDGNGCLYATLQGNTRTVMHKFTVDLPKKHGRGGQSALRFARLRLEKRHNYVRKCAEMAVQFFITDNKCNVAGLILAGSADFKTDLFQSDMFDPRLQKAVVRTVVSAASLSPSLPPSVPLSPPSGSAAAGRVVRHGPRLQPGHRAVGRVPGQREAGAGEAAAAEVLRRDLAGHGQVLLHGAGHAAGASYPDLPCHSMLT